MDNFFTSYELAQELLAHGLSIVGTVRKNKKFNPQGFQANRKRPIGSNLFGFRQGYTLLSHVPKVNKSVIFLSTMHHRRIVNSEGKADINLFYNQTKGGPNVPFIFVPTINQTMAACILHEFTECEWSRSVRSFQCQSRHSTTGISVSA